MHFFKNLKRVYKYSYGCRKYIILYIIFSILITLVGVITPVLSSLQLVNLTAGIWDKVIFYSIFVFLLEIFSNIIGYIISFVSEKFSKIIISKIQIETLKIALS